MRTLKITLYTICAFVLLLFYALAPGNAATLTPSQEADQYLAAIKATHGIPGMAVAVVENGKLRYSSYQGVASIEHQVPVSASTLFPVFSSTKLIVSTAVFQLIDQGKLKLSDPVELYLNDLPESWHGVTIDQLLAHASGLPDYARLPGKVTKDNLLPELTEQPLQFAPGQRFSYNQTNYWLLQRIISKLAEAPFQNFVIEQQFSGIPAGQVCFSSDGLDVIPNRSSRYFYDEGKYMLNHFRADSFAHASNGLNITLPAFVEWGRKFNKGELLSASSKKALWSEFNFQNDKDKFLHGWDIYGNEQIVSYGFTGGGVSGFRQFRDYDLTIIFLSNAYRNLPIHNSVIDHLAGLFVPALRNEEALIAEEVSDAFLNEPAAQAMLTFEKIRHANPTADLEKQLNTLGYFLFHKERFEDGLALFKLNVTENPDSWNVYDSLGEGYEMSGDTENAIEWYQKSVDLNPDNQHGIDKLKLLKTQ